MTILFTLFIFLNFNTSSADNITVEEKMQIMKDVQMLKDKVQKLESIPSASGLKKVDYKKETNQSKSNDAQLTDEQKGNLIRDLNTYKQKQLEAQKILEELDKDE